MPLHVDDYAIDLEQAPECARRIGIILGLFVQVEHGLVPILSWTTAMSLDQAQTALALQKQNARKVQFLQGVCAGISPEWPRDVAAGQAFAAAAMTANRIRNKYAHASYHAAEGDGSERLDVAVFADDLRNAPRVEIATVDILDAEIGFLKALIVAMRNYAAARASNSPINRQELDDLAVRAPRQFLRDP